MNRVDDLPVEIRAAAIRSAAAIIAVNPSKVHSANSPGKEVMDIAVSIMAEYDRRKKKNSNNSRFQIRTLPTFEFIETSY